MFTTQNTLRKSPNGASHVVFGAVTALGGANLSMACNVTSPDSTCRVTRMFSAEADARKRNGPHADLFLDRRSDSEESASSRSDGGPINVETALIKIVVGWLEAARLGSPRSMSCGSKANSLASATGWNRAPWIILRRSCTKRVVQLKFLAFLSSWASWYIQEPDLLPGGSLLMRGGRPRFEIWSSCVSKGVLGRWSKGCYTPCKSARPLQVNPPPLAPGRRFVLVTGVY